MTMTKQEQKNEASEEYWAIDASAWEAYQAKCKEIDAQDEVLQVEKDI